MPTYVLLPAKENKGLRNKRHDMRQIKPVANEIRQTQEYDKKDLTAKIDY